MSEPNAPRERLAAILSADVVGYSRLMSADERATLARLDEYRGVFADAVTAHAGRVVDMAGDSVLAVFDTASGAVQAAIDVQEELAARNADHGDEQAMRFRIGVNLGDILEKADGSIYGDGVNVAARVQSGAVPGGIDIAGSVFRSVRSRYGDSFASAGERQFKNIEDPVKVYRHTGLGDHDAAAAAAAAAGSSETPSPQQRPRVCIMPIKVISGDETVAGLASGLHSNLMLGLGRQPAIRAMDGGTNCGDGDFRLEGSIQAAGKRARLYFTLFDVSAGTQVWSERYERALEDVFELEDEISLNVSASVRISIKAQAFERLRTMPNDQLSVADLLSKGAGYFVTNYRYTSESEHCIRAALAADPDNAMAAAMLVVARYRYFEECVSAIPATDQDELRSGTERALALDPNGDFVNLCASLVCYDIDGDFERALTYIETAVMQNAGLSQAIATRAIIAAHLEDPEPAIPIIERAMAAAPDDPHRFRHQRDLALIYFMCGDAARGVTIMQRLVQLAPAQLRNLPVFAALQWLAGAHDRARETVTRILATEPGITVATLRPAQFHDPAWRRRYEDALQAAGIPSGNSASAAPD